jgi:hypothetical protein
MEILVNTNLRPTPVYDIYWYFACERQSVFFKRLRGMAAPWTNDPIIRKHKFTNAYRVLDRVSQFLIADILNPDASADVSKEDKIFRVLLFKLFNKIETWRLLEEETHGISWARYSFQEYDQVLSAALSKGVTIYSAAYIMASGKSTFGHQRKHQNHLRLLEQMMEGGVTQRISVCSSMAQLYDVLLSYPLIGTFLAYQFATDINYGDVTDFSEEEFVVAGPGARDGIMKCFSDRGNYSDEDVIRFMMDNQEDEFDRLGLNFRDLFGRSLKLIDCQNIFCEVGKYARISHPQISDRSGRARIKQVYRTAGALPVPCFPEKWGLAGAVRRFLETSVRDNGARGVREGVR